MFYFVVTVQTTINTGVSIGAILLAADCLEVRRPSLHPRTHQIINEFIVSIYCLQCRGFFYCFIL